MAREPDADAAKAGTSSAPVPSPTQHPEERVEAELITIRPTGFEPLEITRPRGEFKLTVQNLTGLEELTLRLDREGGGGGRLHEVRTSRGRHNWRKNIDPPPGTYVITEAAHPDWACRVTITGH